MYSVALCTNDGSMIKFISLRRPYGAGTNVTAKGNKGEQFLTSSVPIDVLNDCQITLRAM